MRHAEQAKIDRGYDVGHVGPYEGIKLDRIEWPGIYVRIPEQYVSHGDQRFELAPGLLIIKPTQSELRDEGGWWITVWAKLIDEHDTLRNRARVERMLIDGI